MKIFFAVGMLSCAMVASPAYGQHHQPVALTVQQHPAEAAAAGRPVPTIERATRNESPSFPLPKRASDGPNLPLIGALIGGAVLGAVVLNECIDIGCTSFVGIPLAVGVGAGAGALTGWVIQQLRKPSTPPDPSATLESRRR